MFFYARRAFQWYHSQLSLTDKSIGQNWTNKRTMTSLNLQQNNNFSTRAEVSTLKNAKFCKIGVECAEFKQDHSFSVGLK